tara:strand:+ start:2052 stop:2300 length:249 start_codon:yes stop_codon:yes gene_type:complete
MMILYCEKGGIMSHISNDIIADNVANDVYDLYADKGVWGVINKIASDYGQDKVVYSKDDDDHIDVLINLMYDDALQAPSIHG